MGLQVILAQRGHKATRFIDYAYNAPPPPLGALLPAGWKHWGTAGAVKVDRGGPGGWVQPIQVLDPIIPGTTRPPTP